MLMNQAKKDAKDYKIYIQLNENKEIVHRYARFEDDRALLSHYVDILKSGDPNAGKAKLYLTNLKVNTMMKPFSEDILVKEIEDVEAIFTHAKTLYQKR